MLGEACSTSGKLLGSSLEASMIPASASCAARLQVPIDLANVCFDSGASPDRLAARDALAELQAYAPDRSCWPLITAIYYAERWLGDMRLLDP